MYVTYNISIVSHIKLQREVVRFGFSLVSTLSILERIQRDEQWMWMKIGQRERMGKTCDVM